MDGAHDPHPDLDRPGVSAGARGARLEPAARPLEVCGGQAGVVEGSVCDLARELDRGTPRDAEKERHLALHDRGVGGEQILDLGAFQMDELALIGDLLAAQQRPHDVAVLPHPCHRLLPGNPLRCEDERGAGPEAHDHPAGRDLLERREGDRDDHGSARIDVYDARPDLHAARRLGDRRQRDEAVARHPRLRHPDGLEAALLGPAGERDHLRHAGRAGEEKP